MKNFHGRALKLIKVFQPGTLSLMNPKVTFGQLSINSGHRATVYDTYDISTPVQKITFGPREIVTPITHYMRVNSRSESTITLFPGCFFFFSFKARSTK